MAAPDPRKMPFVRDPDRCWYCARDGTVTRSRTGVHTWPVSFADWNWSADAKWSGMQAYLFD